MSVWYTVLDTSPSLILALEEDSDPVSLAGILSATLRVQKPSGAILDKAMEVDEAQGLVACRWLHGDLDEAGDYYADVLVVRSDSSRQHGISRLLIRVRGEFDELD